MSKRHIAWGTLVAASLLLAACGGAEPTPAEESAGDPATAVSEVTEEPAEPPTQTPVEPTATAEATPTAEPAETADDVQTEPPAGETVVPGRPSEPAQGSAFRSDPAEVVTATGNPQLIEFFTHW